MTVSLAPDSIESANQHVNRNKMVTHEGIVPAYRNQLTVYDANCLAVFAGSVDDISSWVYADLLVWAEQKAKQMAKLNGSDPWRKRDQLWDELTMRCKKEYSQHTRLNMKAVAVAFPFERRRHTEILSFAHHRLLTSRSREEQEYYLDRAESEQWSTARLAAELHGIPTQPGEEVIPRTTFRRILQRAGVHYEQTLPNAATLSIGDNVIEVTAIVDDEDNRPILKFNLQERDDEEHASGL